MSIFYVAADSGSDDRWNSSSSSKRQMAPRPRTPGRVRSKSQAELVSPGKMQSMLEQEAYAREFQVDPHSMQSILENPSAQQNSSSSRYTMAGGAFSAPKVEQAVEDNKRASIYYGALRVPVKSTAPTPSRVATRVEAQPTPSGLLSSARRVEIKTPGPSLSQTPSRRQTTVGQQATPGRIPLASGASRMNAISEQLHTTQKSYETPARGSHHAAPSPSLQKKNVVVEETYIRRLTYDDADQYGSSFVPQEIDTTPDVPNQHMEQSTQLFEKQQPQRPAPATLHGEPISQHKKVQFQEEIAAQANTECRDSRDAVEKRLIANQRRRRELMAELQRLDAEQMDLINELQSLPK